MLRKTEMKYISGAVRQFSLWFANASIGGELLKGYEEDFYEMFKEENSWVEQTFVIFMNNLQVDKKGNVLNYKYCENRAAQYVRLYMDPTYVVEPKFENWEYELQPVSKDSYMQ